MIVQSYHEENFDLCVEFLHLLGIRHTEIFQPLETRQISVWIIIMRRSNGFLNRILFRGSEQWGREQKWLGKIVVDCSREEKRQYESSMFPQRSSEIYGEFPGDQSPDCSGISGMWRSFWRKMRKKEQDASQVDTGQFLSIWGYGSFLWQGIAGYEKELELQRGSKTAGSRKKRRCTEGCW